jgi:anti-sigma B factor antagonist
MSGDITSMPVVVALPGEIDTTNASEILALIIAAVVPGVSVIIADLTATSFCDSSGLRHLLLAYRQAAAAGAQLRLAIPPRGPIGRLIQLTGIDRHVPVYPTLQLASDGGPPPAR